jgi:PAS domain S-box-containing protein
MPRDLLNSGLGMVTDFATLMLKETPDAVIVTTPQGEVACWTSGARGVFGYSETEALGHTLLELIVPDGRADDERDILRQTLECGFASYESLRRAKDGALVYIDSSSKAVYDGDGRVEYILWSKKDVTHLKVLRDAKQVQSRFGDLLESTPDAIVMANAAGRIVLANGHAEALFGYGRGEMRGRLLESLLPQRFRSAHVFCRGEYCSQAPDALAPREMGAGRKLFGLRRNGEEFPVEVSLNPIATDEGTLIMSAIRDTSERERIEQALQEKNIELENANRAKDRFLASMSHELRTPLNAIIGFTGTLLMKLPGPLNADQERQLQIIQGSARHLLSLINDLLDLTKIESGKVELQVEPLSCLRLIEDLLPIFRPEAQRKGLALRFEAPDEDVVLRADRRALQQIMINLINNAIKFTERGEIRVALAQVQTDDRRALSISVADTGSGITGESQAQLFQAFTQVDGSAARQLGGTGLGLYLSQRLAAMLGGRIMFQSEYGRGSIFTLALPME